MPLLKSKKNINLSMITDWLVSFAILSICIECYLLIVYGIIYVFIYILTGYKLTNDIVSPMDYILLPFSIIFGYYLTFKLSKKFTERINDKFPYY